MVTKNDNPFVLPGFGQSGEIAQNPLLASMEMMRKAWDGLASSGGFNQTSMAAPMSVEDLERRINDLRAVENWLRMNLSMLSGTIQGLEVQRSTISTLKSFVTSAASMASAGSESKGLSPLEAVLGMQAFKPATDNKQEAASTSKAGAKTDKAQQGTSAEDLASQAKAASEAMAANAATAAQGWWDMVQKQFDSLAQATTASLQGADAAKAAALKGATGSSADSTLGKFTPKAASKKTAESAPSAAKHAAKKAAPRKRTSASRKP
ncbi:transcriptional regulator [Candidimonas sp. SYP-B2681]|uniref:PhaM family polyhydroxyalkanoate granule multifunctional regulatory protein n=1 Tax=Candidimonas sp. SYP-B2681 TaxID=2497686 RepID=UPI000F889397|nr:PhaM family polyhydroxyalkanoate granule multifunctional regulatory protein [Candidimonas sp. SYP-B2681]RTZ45449.1 transcriptional regulator [Candidimonas sp. SYP-B2681]